MIAFGHGSTVVMLTLGWVAGTAAMMDPCACKYETGLPETYWKGGQYGELGMIPAYGTACSPWDSIPETPWYADYCDTSAGKDYCTNADGWCDDAWCYVDKTCPTWTATSVFADVPGASADLGYSYQTCGSMNCYTDSSAPGCPYDAYGHCPDPCACKYKNGLPKEFWEGGKHNDKAMISQYGVDCIAWDSLPGTPWYTEYCDVNAGKDYCTRADSWCNAQWCYVDKACPTWVATSVFADVEGAPDNLGYSYVKCGATDCYTDSSVPGCPYDPDGTCCQCIYQSGLPQAFWQDGQYTDLPMISHYGVTCASWDSIPGTPWFDAYCDTAKGVDYCTSSWCNDPWCYVDKDRCNSWVATSVFKDVAAAPDNMGYSYHHCNSPDCYNNASAKGCPHDPRGECDKALCSDVKAAYKAGGCCGNPSKKISMG
jgi:hypothetical protein